MIPRSWHEADLSTYFCNVLFRGAAMLAFATGMGAKLNERSWPESGLSAFGLLAGKADADLHPEGTSAVLVLYDAAL